ncbi:sigma-54-dependent Fis family transcriptional regulator [bacterium]|nr:sigma-54-dependent Fis family transcriptional regulator [bacterium]
MNNRYHILIAEDDEAFAGQLKSTLIEDGFRVTHVRDGSEALVALKNDHFDLGFVDLAMPGVDGMEVIKESIRISPDVPLIMITGYATIKNAVKATQLGAYDFIEKPVSLDRLLLTARHALEKRTLEQKSRWMANEVYEKYKMIGISPAMKLVYEIIDKIADSESTVLITGETGTGKELAAMALHLQSRRASGPIIKINCAAIPETMIESELFGHKKGAFTGAIGNKDGKFALADRGTIFLDEIGDMSLMAQAKVLRVLQEQEFEPLGDTKTRKVDVRVIAATNQDLWDKIKLGTFREDLYYRLDVLALDLPPLRRRREDIPILAYHFIQQHCRTRNRYIQEPDARVNQLLMQYEWPGNVRELRATMEKLVVLASGDIITTEDILKCLNSKYCQTTELTLNYKETVREMERSYLKEALAVRDWNVGQTARDLEIDRTNLYKKMRQLGIEKP